VRAKILEYVEEKSRRNVWPQRKEVGVGPD